MNVGILIGFILALPLGVLLMLITNTDISGCVLAGLAIGCVIGIWSEWAD
jgi:hypothetical protein